MVSYHVHAVNWNESRLLPVFFRHYDSADKIYIHDNESDPEVREEISKFGAEIVPYSTGGKFDDVALQQVKNSAWKRSRGNADFIIIQDLDELTHFPWAPGDIKSALALYKALGITCARSKCYSVVCSDKEWDGILSSQAKPWTLFRRGFRGDLFTAVDYDKVQVFSPMAINDANFAPGAHVWSPNGSVHPAPPALQPLMLHCKHIGMEYEFERRKIISQRMSDLNKQRGTSWHYSLSLEEVSRRLRSVYESDKVEEISRHLDGRGEPRFSFEIRDRSS